MTARKPRGFTATCPECGWTSTPTTHALATKALATHSCDLHRARQATARRVANRRSRSGPGRDCIHVTIHGHGQRARYTLDGCRCRPCRDACTAYNRRRNRALAYGTWDTGMVDPGPVRDHVHALLVAGIGERRIAELAGIDRSAVTAVLRGRRGHPLTRMSQVNAHALLAVHPTPANAADGARVDVTGTRRRVQALSVAGWSLASVARHLEVNPTNLPGLLAQAKVSARRARQITDLYDQLRDQPPPTDTSAQRASTARARAMAGRRGWAGPDAWDDDTIDDPATKPRRPRKTLTHQELATEVRTLIARGDDLRRAATALGMEADSLHKRLRRCGETFLLRQLRAAS